MWSGLFWNMPWRRAQAGKFPLSIKEQWVPGQEESCSFPWAPSEYLLVECHVSCHVAGMPSPGTPGHEMAPVGQTGGKLGKFPGWMGFSGAGGKVRNGWMWRLEQQCQLQICHPHLTSSTCQYPDVWLHVRNPRDKYNHLPTWST